MGLFLLGEYLYTVCFEDYCVCDFIHWNYVGCEVCNFYRMHRVLMEKMSLKRVSVVLCTYNGEKYIREQLESIVSQTYPIHELLIQDDCSPDYSCFDKI